MKKNNLIIIVILIVIVVVAGWFFAREKGSLDVDGLLPIELTSEERQALQDEGIDLPSNEEDSAIQALQDVSASDELDAIEAELNATDLLDLDAELYAIDKKLIIL